MTKLKTERDGREKRDIAKAKASTRSTLQTLCMRWSVWTPRGDKPVNRALRESIVPHKLIFRSCNSVMSQLHFEKNIVPLLLKLEIL